MHTFWQDYNLFLLQLNVRCKTIIFIIAAIAHLDKIKVWGKNIRVTQSKHALVQMPKDGQPVSYPLPLPLKFQSGTQQFLNLKGVRYSVIPSAHSSV